MILSRPCRSTVLLDSNTATGGAYALFGGGKRWRRVLHRKSSLNQPMLARCDSSLWRSLKNTGFRVRHTNDEFHGIARMTYSKRLL